ANQGKAPKPEQGKAPKPEQGKANALRALTKSAKQTTSSRKSHRRRQTPSTSPRQDQIPLYESNTHILEISKKPPYNPTQHAP
ncbi:hypothetical protein PQR25_03890, partial [Paraburkholderia nemoris]|uniref:hypothetical protein n=1 Tax=Paraburkholderia nemoris TaxID=2793076 RepID=UPI0038BAF719